MTKLTVSPKTRMFTLEWSEEGGETRTATGRVTICGSPTCNCRSMGFLADSQEPADGRGAAASPRLFDLDPLDRCCPSEYRKNWTAPDLGERLAAELTAGEWESLQAIFMAQKAHIIESASLRDERFPFDFRSIESTSVLVPYTECFPFRPSLPVVVAGTRYVVDDQYCVRVGCDCADVTVSFYPLGAGTQPVEPVCALRVAYKKPQWEDLHTRKSPQGLARDLMVALQEQYPDVLRLFAQRHARMRNLYRYSRAELWYDAGPPVVHSQAKVGRNDPCPCGSGKKYKKCCLEKDAHLARENRTDV